MSFVIGEMMRRRSLISAGLLVALSLLLSSVSPAGAAISFEEGPDTVKTPKFEMDFGDDGGTVEWVRELKWRDSGGTLGGDLTAENGVGGGGCGGAPTEFWGQSYGNQDFHGPAPVVSGTYGNWGVRGGRSLEINSVASTPCSGDTPGIPVRTRYSFFDSGTQANMIRVERHWSFALNQVSSNPAQGMRTYVPRLSSGVYNQEIYPKADSSGLNTDGIGEVIQTDWNDTWMAINASSTNSGVLLLRDPADTSPASIRVDYDGSSGSNNSGITLDRPAPDGWLAPVTETEYLCFYDATSWPPGERSPTRLPDGCAPATPPINVTPPTVSAGAGNPTLGESFTASSGTWDYISPGAFTFQWSRCDENLAEETVCQEVPGATGNSYTATAGDLGQSLRVAVTATGPGGEDTAESNISGSISGTVYEGEKASGKEAAGAPVQVCRRSGSPCRSAVADADGFYRVQVPVSGKYRVTAFPPSGSKAASHTRRTIARVRPEEESGGQDVVLPLPQAPPPQVDFTGAGVRNNAPGGVPVVHWQEPFVLEYEAAKGAEVETKIAFPQAPSIRVQPVSSEPSLKDPNKEIFKFPFPPLYPNHGDALISIVVLGGAGQAQEEIEAEEEEQEEEEQEDEEEEEEEPEEEEETPEEEEDEEEREDKEEEQEEQEEENEEEATFPIYIDPSGFVRTTGGAPLPGATVILLRSDAKTGPFTVVPDGSAVMSPMNRVNPDLSEADGHFGWDVVAGFYKVRAQKAGCNAPSNPGSAFSETTVMTIPPPVTNLDIRLECPAPSNPSPPSGTPQLGAPPASVLQPKPLKCRKGFVKKKVKGKARCVKKKKRKKKKKH